MTVVRPSAPTGRWSVQVREVALSAPWQWLARGAQDFLRAPSIGLAHGAACAAFGALLLVLAHDRFWVLAGAMSGFLLMAPLVATGLYAVSHALERGEPAGAACVWRIWRSLDGRLVGFGLGLAAAGTGWVGVSAALITLHASEPVDTPMAFLRLVAGSRGLGLFEVWTLLGGALAAPVFASSVVAIPLLLDRPALSMWDAVLTSWRTVLANPAPLALWATVLVSLSLLSLGAALVGLLVAVPVLGHASWHAYRALVVPASEGPAGGVA